MSQEHETTRGRAHDPADGRTREAAGEGAAGAWRIEVDRLGCAGTGLCLGTAHGRMRLDGGRARPVDEVIDPDEAVLDAAETCPMEAITVRDAETGQVLAPLR
ncbi:ferredoxin [Streptomyces fradiae]|uniref:ferredoxin n=1 Tax=Streptomyces fradiae TaxID=1906 RepID=UPI002941C552|nr:ferredoxin [Streptomyces fradiae]WOI58906.1 ferredoxin [Streptomyces fradiae]